jgi:hypothetical protein
MKSISSDKSTIVPFKVHKSQVDSKIFGVTLVTSASINIDLGDVPPANWKSSFNVATEPRNADGISTRTLYSGVLSTFYNTQSLWDAGMDIFSGSTQTRGYTPSSSIAIINIPQMMFGEGILPGSFTIGTTGTGSIHDDGLGHLVYGTITGSYCGNIFYGLGIAVLDRSLTQPLYVNQTPQPGAVFPQGLFLVTGSVVNFSFKATQTIYEYQVICTLNPLEYNYSMNPTAVRSGSFALMSSGSLRPYVTEVGLYNDAQELIAIAKFPRPIKRISETDQTFIIRFDT